MSLSSQERIQYTSIIDELLSKSDPDTVSVRRIRKGLESRLGKDLTEHKELIADLVGSRFDHVFPDVSEAANGTEKEDNSTASTSLAIKRVKSEATSPSPKKPISSESKTSTSPPPSRKATSTTKATTTSDAALAARLQAEENRLSARPSRSGTGTPATKKRSKAISTATTPSSLKKSKKPKTAQPKSAAKVKTSDNEDDEDDDDDDDDGITSPAPSTANKKNPFNKPLLLSPALSALLDGETRLSRPQTVKRIWAHIKANGLQDPEDRRQILCDEAMKAVFCKGKTEGQARVHMFTMNKLLSAHLYPIEDSDSDNNNSDDDNNKNSISNPTAATTTTTIKRNDDVEIIKNENES